MMSSEEESKEEVICAVCSKFEPQAWRKKFCRNCFNSLEDHSVGVEKETGSEKVENEKNLKKTEEKKDEDEIITKDKLINDSTNKVSSKSTEKLSSKDTTKQTEKTSALADKISKKLTGSTDKTSDKKTDEKPVKTAVTDKLKNKFEAITKNEKPSDKDAKTLDDNQSKLNSDKTKNVIDKSKSEAKSTEKRDEHTKGEKVVEKDKSKEKSLKDENKTPEEGTKPAIKTFKLPEKQDTRMKWNKMWGSSLPSQKDDKPKVDSLASQKEDKPKVDSLASQKDDKLKVDKDVTKTDEESSTKHSIKAKFESKDTGSLWGVSKPLEKKIDRASVERKTPETKTTSKEPEKSKDIISTKESEKSKIDDSKTLKVNEKSKVCDSKESEKSKVGDKINQKEAEKSKFGDKSTPKDMEKNKEKITLDKGDKFGVKLAQKESDKSKINETVTSKEQEKSKFGDKLTTKDSAVSKFGEKITPKESEKFGDKITSKEQEKSKFGDKISSKEQEKSKLGDKVTEKSKFGDKVKSKESEKSGDKFDSKGQEKSKFGDKFTSQEQEKSKFGAKTFEATNKTKPAGEIFTLKERDKTTASDKVNLKSNDTQKSVNKNEKLNTEDEKQKVQNTKPQEKSKIDELKSKIDNKTNKFGLKSKFDKNEDKSTSKDDKVKLDEKTTKVEMDRISQTDNQKNEKLEGKLKLDIKKAEKANKFDKESSPVSQSLAERMKDKYEKISKTPTSTTASKTPGQKAYGRSKSDGTVIQDKLSEKTSNVPSPDIKSPLSSGKIKDKLSSQPITDDKKSELLENETKLLKKGEKSSVKAIQDDVKVFTDAEVKDVETSQSTEQSLPKLNTDDINKIKEAAKFLLEDDFDDARYNSLGRRNSGNKSTPSPQATALSSSASQQADDNTSAAEHSVQGKTVKSKTALEKEKHGVEVVFNEKFNSETERLKKQLKQMEERCSELEEENKNLKNGLQENEKHSVRLMKQKQDVENSIKVLQKSLSSIESKCSKLEMENSNLIERIKIAQAKCEGNSAMDLKLHNEELDHLRERLQQGELIVEELRDDNENLKQEILDLKGEMEEMYDTFRDQEAEEFRDVQREMEMHAKNCRVLSFKLRKYERLTEQMEAEKENYEDKIQTLQNQISDGDTRAHIRDIEDELRLAKEVSVRLHDELDILEEKKCKCEDENQQLTQILEQSDKKQFRLEMEVDKLRDQVTEFKKKIAEKSTPGTPVSQDDIKDRRF